MAKVSATSRLLRALEYIAAESGKQKRETTLGVVLMSYMGVPPEEGWQDEARPPILYARLIALCVESIEEVESCFDDSTLHDEERKDVRLKASRPLRGVLSMFASKSVVRPAAEFVTPELGALVPLALATQQLQGAESVRKEQLAQIREAISTLRDALQSSSLPPELRLRFIQVLRRLESALDEYEAFGLESVLSTVGALVGVATIARAQVNPETQPEVWEKLSNLVTLVGAIDISYRVASFAIASASVLRALN